MSDFIPTMTMWGSEENVPDLIPRRDFIVSRRIDAHLTRRKQSIKSPCLLLMRELSEIARRKEVLS